MANVNQAIVADYVESFKNYLESWLSVSRIR